MKVPFYKKLGAKEIRAKSRAFKALVECDPVVYVFGQLENSNSGNIAFIDEPLKILKINTHSIELEVDGARRCYNPETLREGAFFFCETEIDWRNE